MGNQIIGKYRFGAADKGPLSACRHLELRHIKADVARLST